MGTIFHNGFQLFFMIGYLILLVISIIILRPFRVHKKRPVSTISLKVSYLVFLLLFLSFTYLLLFGEKELDEEQIPYDTLFNRHFLFFLSSTIIPNVGIMLRKQIKRKRVFYNIAFTIVNLIYAAYLLWAIFTGKWALL
jgi:hypothetical protein